MQFYHMGTSWGRMRRSCEPGPVQTTTVFLCVYLALADTVQHVYREEQSSYGGNLLWNNLSGLSSLVTLMDSFNQRHYKYLYNAYK